MREFSFWKERFDQWKNLFPNVFSDFEALIKASKIGKGRERQPLVAPPTGINPFDFDAFEILKNLKLNRNTPILLQSFEGGMEEHNRWKEKCEELRK